MIALTLAACLAALLFRTPLRSRYWAWQVVRTCGIEERVVPLTQLCNAGDAGRWGTEALLTHVDADIRQFGVFVLQHVRSEWSRRRLLQMLLDQSDGVREMAVVGLAIHGDATIIPELERLYAGEDPVAAATACVALERLATPKAVAAMTKLATWPAGVTRRAALIDALAGVGTADSAVPLLDLLNDHRSCDVPTRAVRLLERFAPLAAESGFVEAALPKPGAHPTTEPAPQTIAERAAAALGQITGLRPPFASDMPEQQREDAERVWRNWAATQRRTP